MPDILITIIAFIILIGVLVFIHELGHFLAARWTGMRADVFAVGMGPRLFGWNRINGFTFGKLPETIELGENTDYRISALPIGGYVKILGMVDETMDTEFANRPPEPWEFRSKNTFQKAFVLSAGVLMNILLAILLIAGIKLFYGDEIVKTTTVGVLSQEGSQGVAYRAGLQQGDKITAVNDVPVDNYTDLRDEIYLGQIGKDITFSVDRNGRPITVTIPRDSISNNLERDGVLVMPDGLNLVVNGVIDDAPADTAGILAGDTILALDGRRIGSTDEFGEYVTSHAEEPIAITVRRGSSEEVFTVTPDNGKIGVEYGPVFTGPTERRTYPIGAAFGEGFEFIGKNAQAIGDLIGNLFQGKQNLGESVAGPVKIFKMSGEQFQLGPERFLLLMASLSVMLAILNILPIPALDGGHLVFVLIEGVIRREIPLKVRLAAQQVGIVLLLGFMIFVFYNDFSKM